VNVTLTSTGPLFGGLFGGSDPTWTVPSGITSVNVVLIAAGAGGSTGSEGNPYLSGGGGGGGGGIRTATLSVTPGSQIRYRCGRGGAGAISTSPGGIQGGAGGSTYFGSLSVTGGLPSQSGISSGHYNNGGPAGPGGSDGTPGQTRRQETSGANIMGGGAGGGVPGYSTGGEAGQPQVLTTFNFSSRELPGTTAVTHPAWNATMNSRAVWGPVVSTSTFSSFMLVDFPYTGNYTFQLQADNSGSVSVDSTTVVNASNNFNGAVATVTRSFTQGLHTVSVSGTNTGTYSSGNPGGLGLAITGQGYPTVNMDGSNGSGPGAGGGGGAGGINDRPQASGGNGVNGIIYLSYTIFE
jgi:hypothetical protein